MERAKRLLKNFIDGKLGGNIEKLASFDMEELKGDKDFGCKNKRFEYDNSELVKALFVVLWHDMFAEKGVTLDSDCIGEGKTFRGDTIHTSGALLGQKRKDNGEYEGLNDRYGIHDENLMKRIATWPVSRIGNMLLLPAKSLCVTNAKGTKAFVTINTFRGFASGWHDYFDIFLEKLREVLDAGISSRTIENEISLPNIMSLAENRSQYFDCFDSFDDWMNRMMLNDCYLNKDTGELKKLFSMNFKDYPYHSRYRIINNERREKYCEFVWKFLDSTTVLINARSKRMVMELKRKLNVV